MKTRTKTRLVIPLLNIAHLISGLLYLYFPIELKHSTEIFFTLTKPVSYIDFFGAWYFGCESLFFCLFLSVTKFEDKNIIERGFIDAERLFIGLRGMIYILNGLNIYTFETKNKVIMLGGSFLIASCMIFISAYRHGLLKRDE